MKLPDLPNKYSITSVATVLVLIAGALLGALWKQSIGRLISRWKRADNEYWEAVLQIKGAQHVLDLANRYLFAGVRMEANGRPIYVRTGGGRTQAIGQVCFIRGDGSVAFETLIWDDNSVRDKVDINFRYGNRFFVRKDDEERLQALFRDYSSQPGLRIVPEEMERLGVHRDVNSSPGTAADAAMQLLEEVRIIASRPMPTPNWRQSREDCPDLDAWLSAQ